MHWGHVSRAIRIRDSYVFVANLKYLDKHMNDVTKIHYISCWSEWKNIIKSNIRSHNNRRILDLNNISLAQVNRADRRYTSMTNFQITHLQVRKWGIRIIWTNKHVELTHLRLWHRRWWFRFEVESFEFLLNVSMDSVDFLRKSLHMFQPAQQIQCSAVGWFSFNFQFEITYIRLWEI